ncbi:MULTISPECIES: DUF6883 domain-containing protein [unclassified Microcystis]|uniref:DUF6883 domain-containing protein n=1 Tax=unclassified Microcystis TaxID=2643300 RepID=UPI00338FF365
MIIYEYFLYIPITIQLINNNLEQDLRRILLNEATLNKQTKFGDIYEIKGLLQGVNGINLRVSTYWIIDSLTKETRFVTLLPD